MSIGRHMGSSHFFLTDAVNIFRIEKELCPSIQPVTTMAAIKKSLAILLTTVSLMVCVVTSFFWGVSEETRLNLVWASGRTKYDVISDSGMVYLVKCHNWWCEVHLYIDSEPNSSDWPIEKWVGMHDVTRSNYLGCVYARGNWVSPYIHVTEDMVIRKNPALGLKLGTMFYSITPFQAYGLPYWIIVAISAVLPLRIAYKALTRCGATLSPIHGKSGKTEATVKYRQEFWQ